MTEIRQAQRVLLRQLRERGAIRHRRETRNLAWLRKNLNPYFFLTMAAYPEALDLLVAGLHTLGDNRHLLLAEREDLLIVAGLSEPGSIYETLTRLQHTPSYAEITHSYAPPPGCDRVLEIQRYEFSRVSCSEIRAAGRRRLPRGVRPRVEEAMARLYPDFDLRRLPEDLRLLALNHPAYLKNSPPERIARLLWLYRRGRENDGLYFAVEKETAAEPGEIRVLFSVGNPPERGFLEQVLEVFHRLGAALNRAYCLEMATGVNPHFLGTFYLDSGRQYDEEFFARLRRELYNTQILNHKDTLYRHYVLGELADGEALLLIDALVTFCHTNLAHTQPDIYDLAEIRRAFIAAPEIALGLVRAFRARFSPEEDDCQDRGAELLAGLEEEIAAYNTGHRHFDTLRRTIFRCALLLVRFTLKCNFFVPEKHALAFRLDPAYLDALGKEFTNDLPEGAAPFRITYFFGRYGAGYHIGFSDIARGGWRTISCASADDFLATAATLFREVYVLAHTQHLKNKDIYEGGSKMVVVHNVSDLKDPAARRQSLHKLQYGFSNAFFDIFVTDAQGRALNPNVVDYYGEAEPIELGPDENMHDEMIELIAKQSVKRGYILGSGVISSKKVGINHKQYGVTSLGVITFAEITLRELGIEMRRDAFRVKLTGGPNGDVAGNAMRLLLERCPQVRIVLIVAGSGVICDPEGIDREELERLILKENVNAFAPEKLHPGGFILLSRERRREGLVELYRRLARTSEGVQEEWVTTDEFHREFDNLIFTESAELFIPAGGRPETVDESNWERFFAADGTPSCKAIVEGANSFITPAAREQLQERGIVVIRDAAANKCGVISSSYEIIANLVLSEREFIRHKERYVADVLAILVRRAADEARLLFKRRRESRGTLSFTAIAGAISSEINHNYGRLFDYFLAHPEQLETQAMRRVLRHHLPTFLCQPRYLARLPEALPLKYRAAMVAAELGARMVYDGDWGRDFGAELKAYVQRKFGRG